MKPRKNASSAKGVMAITLMPTMTRTLTAGWVCSEICFGVWTGLCVKLWMIAARIPATMRARNSPASPIPTPMSALAAVRFLNPKDRGPRLWTYRTHRMTVTKSACPLNRLSLDRRSEAGQRVFERLVAAIDVLNTGDLGRAHGSKAGDHQGCSGPDVGRAHRRALQLVAPADDGVVAFGTDVRAHADELVHEHEPVLEHVLGGDARPRPERAQHHHLRLQVGREPRVRQRDEVDRARLLGHDQPDSAGRRDDVGTGVTQLRQHDVQMLGARAFDEHVAARRGRGEQQRAG